MGQCREITRKGKQCDIPTKDGEIYCHVHLRKKPKNITKILSWSAVIAFIVGAFGVLANLSEILAFFNLDFSSLSQTSTPTPSFIPTPTPNAYEVDVAKFSSDDFIPEDKMIVNLDGFGSDELIIRNSTSPWQTYAIKVLAHVPNSNFGEFEYPGEWETILTITMDMCGYLDYGVVDLKKDGQKQIVVYRRCGTGSFVYLQMYEYKGLRLMELIYEQNEPIWEGATIRIANETAYLIFGNRTYVLSWVEGVGIEPVKLDPPISSKTKSVSYWRDENRVFFTSQSIELKKGETFRVYHDTSKETLPCVPRFSVGTGIETTEYPDIFVATESGLSEITIICWGGEAAGKLTLDVDNFP